VLAGSIALAACARDDLPPAGEVRFHVVTDAPVAGDPDAPALFDRVEIAIVRSDGTNACDDCTRTIVLSKAALDADISFGVVPPPGTSDLVLHARMYLSRHGLDDDADAVVESWTSMPTVGDEGIIDLTLSLPIASVGTPMGSLAAPVAPTLGLPDRSFIGSFTGGVPRPCDGASPAGAVCVPGGAAWMGDSTFRDVSRTRQGGLRRIIVVSPFHLDATEVTVSAFRKSGLAKSGDPGLTSQNNSPSDFCTYSETPSPADDVLPLTCITRSTAAAYCKRRGGHLPTEAQLAYAQGGRLGMPYVWGDTLPACEDASWGRVPPSYSGAEANDCAGLSARDGAQPVGHGLLDRLALPGGVIVDLNGNVSEIAQDDFEADGGKCWPVGVLVDPVCTIPGGSPVIHGGSFMNFAIDLRSGQRFSIIDAFSSATLGFLVQLPQLGFRCAYDDQ